MNKLIDYLTREMRQFPTTIEEDEELLEEEEELNQNERNCILLRQSEKLVVQSWLEFAEYALNYIETFEHSKLWAKTLEDNEIFAKNPDYFHKVYNQTC